MATTSVHHHRRRKHKNIFMFIVGLIAVIIISRSQLFQLFFQSIQNYPILAAFTAGMLFASTFSIAAGGLIIINLVPTVNPVLLIICGGLGAVSCDLLIFYFFKDKVAEEISPIYSEIISKSHLKKLMHTRFFAWTLPVIGALVIASPLPDELGVSLMGFSQMKLIQFVLISFGSHLIGMTSLIVGAQLF